MVSVVIVNWNTKEKLRSCLRSLASQTVPLQVIVVDNNSSDGSAEMVETEFSNVELCAENRNHGYALGNNIGFSRSTFEFILTLNADTELPPDNLHKAIQILSQHPKCGALSTKFIGPEGETQNSVRGFPSIAGIFGQLTGMDKIWPESAQGSYSLPNFDYERSQSAPQPMGTYLMFRRSVLAQFCNPAAPFDEQFPIYFNEVDLLYRMKLAGFDCWYESSLSIFHHHGSSTKQVRKSMIWESHLSLVRYLRKHLVGPARLALPAIHLASVVAAFIRAKGYHGGFKPEHHNL